MSPFAFGFLGAVPFEFCFAVFTGSTVGYLVNFSGMLTLRYILCLFIICTVRLVAGKCFKDYNSARLNLIAVTASTCVTCFLSEISFVSFLAAIVESGLAFCSCYFFVRSFRTPVFHMGLSRLSVFDKISLIFSFCSFIVCFSGVEIEGFSPARLCCFLLLCLLCYCQGAPGGSIIGVCLAASVSLRQQMNFIFPAFALSGLLGGVFSSQGQLVTGVAGSLAYCAVCLLFSRGQEMIFPVTECVIAALTFMLIPSSWLSRLSEKLNRTICDSSNQVDLQVSAILEKASQNIYSFCETVTSVSDKLDRVINPEINKLFFELQQKVCDGCGQKTACWSRNFDATAFDVMTILGTHKRTKSRLALEKRCSRLHELKRQIIASRPEYSLSMAAKMKNGETRRLLTEQFCGMGDFLNELSKDIVKSRCPDNAKATALRGAIIDSGLYVDSISCFGGFDCGLTVEAVSLEPPFETDYRKIHNIIEEVTGRNFLQPEISHTQVGTVMRFEEKSVFELAVGFAQRSFVRDQPCGDSVVTNCINSGKQSVILSDGMGTGACAALDSTMTVTLLEKLISCGFSFDSAVKIVNSSLIIKSTDESMATVDGFFFNLFTGKGEFYKAGAALSFIRRGREVYTLEESSLPLGILREINFVKVTKAMEAGDIVLLLSDGVTAGDCGWISDELLSWSTNSMDDLSRHIVELAALRQDRRNGDDLTAVAVKVVPRREGEELF